MFILNAFTEQMLDLDRVLDEFIPTQDLDRMLASDWSYCPFQLSTPQGVISASPVFRVSKSKQQSTTLYSTE